MDVNRVEHRAIASTAIRFLTLQAAKLRRARVFNISCIITPPELFLFRLYHCQVTSPVQKRYTFVPKKQTPALYARVL